MQFWDYHTHNYLCNHATGTIEEYVQAAINKNLCEIGLSDHFPYHLFDKATNLQQWTMTIEQFPQYLSDAKALQEKYKNKIHVRVASEVDFTCETFSQYKTALKPFMEDLEYIIGSVHILTFDNVGIQPIDAPESPALFREMGVDLIFQKYYEANIQMVKTGFYDIVGHCDLPKKFGDRPSEGIWELTLDFLDAVEASNMIVEINHAGFYKPIGEQYPDDKIVRELIEREIPLVFSSDAHEPQNISYKFEDSLKKWTKIAQSMKKPLKLTKIGNNKEHIPVK